MLDISSRAYDKSNPTEISMNISVRSSKMAPAPGFEPGSSARQAEMIGQATPRERDGGPEHFVYSLCQKEITFPC